MAYTLPGSLPMKLVSFITCLALVACGGAADEAEAQTASPASPSSPALPAGHTALPMPAEQVNDIARPFGTPHESLADGVPLSYDWARASRLGRGNEVPNGYAALTGWGQVFWAAGSSGSGQAVELKESQTYLCTSTGGTRRWQRVQQGAIEGAAFRADFAGNENVPATVTQLAEGHLRIGFPAGRAFHYWPRQGRAALASGDPVCGVLVVFQARVVAADGSALPGNTQPALLIGGGADYWASTTAAWNQYQTNQDVGIGQLRRLGRDWRWYGITTAAQADLQRLLQEGFVDRAGRQQ